jgi:hypothetical protein
MGFTPRTHPQLETLAVKHLRQQSELRKYNVEDVIANLMEELFHPHPEGSGSGVRPEDGAGPSAPIPGAWNI